MSKAALNALEKIWLAEIENRLPFQSRAAIYLRLAEEGLVERGERVFGAGERFPVTVSGWYLTHAGRFLYCSSC